MFQPHREVTPDPKKPVSKPRYGMVKGRWRASPEQWREIAQIKFGACRVCETRGGDSMHHLVPRSQRGDDLPQNIVVLCGTGTTGCHGLIEAMDRHARMRLRANLLDSEVAYCIRKKGLGWLNRRYPPPNE